MCCWVISPFCNFSSFRCVIRRWLSSKLQFFTFMLWLMYKVTYCVFCDRSCTVISCKPLQDHFYTGTIFSLQFTKKPFGGRAVSGPAGGASVLPQASLAAVGGLLLRGEERRGQEGRPHQCGLTIRAAITCSPTISSCIDLIRSQTLVISACI